MSARILPGGLVQAVDRFIGEELTDARKYGNREPLDESGAYSLHELAVKVYAAGWLDGERAEAERQRGQRSRERDAARADQ